MVHAVICDVGCEIVLSEVLSKKYSVKNVRTFPSVIQFDSDFIVLCEIAYTFQGAIKVLADVQQFSVSENLDFSFSKEQIEDSLKLLTDKEVQISCVRQGNHNFTSVDAAKYVSDNISLRKKPKALVEVFLYIFDSQGYMGIDVAGRNLAKRDYKIFMGAASLRGTLAYSLVAFSKIKEKDVILDPFMGSGMIVIEAALDRTNHSPFFYSKEKFSFVHFDKLDIDWDVWFSKIDAYRKKTSSSIYGFDGQLKFLKYTQKNAKIADINKDLILSKVDIDWLDTKLEEKSIDVIITDPPLMAERSSKSSVLKIYKDFFNQAGYVLKKKGKIIILTNDKSSSDLITTAKTNGFKEIETHIVYEGQQERMVIIFDYA